MIKFKKGRGKYMRNIKIFLISFAVGLVIFGIGAAMLISYGTKALSGSAQSPLYINYSVCDEFSDM